MNRASNQSGPKPPSGRPYAAWWLRLLAALFLLLLGLTPLWPGGPQRLSEWIPTGLSLFVISFVAASVLVGGWWLVRWASCGRHLQRLLLVAAGILVLIGLFYVEEDWRGWQTWNRFKREWEQKGERFDLAAVVPAPVPEPQNFALTPIVSTSYGQILTREGQVIPPEKRDGHFDGRMRMALHDYFAPTNCAGDWTRGVATRLEGWQRYYCERAARTNDFPVPAQAQSPAADVLLALSRYDAAIEELRAASRLPLSRFPINYNCQPPWNILLPHLAALKSCAQVLSLRSVAELQNGQPSQALDDVRLGLQLTDKIATEPFLISHLVRLAMVRLMLQPVWEGLADHRWQEPQLAALEAEFLKLDWPAAWRQSMRGELAGFSASMQFLRRHPEKLRELEDLRGLDGRSLELHLPGGLAAWLIPAGWFYQNQQRGAHCILTLCVPLADTDRGTFSPAAARRAETIPAADIAGPFQVYARRLLPELSGAAKRFAYGQAAVNLARTAIAFERWRLAHGAFPESLDQLAPRYVARLPRDVVGDRELNYRRETNGQFHLYSVGWNETDDGGVTRLKPDGTLDMENGDWVWRLSPSLSGQAE